MREFRQPLISDREKINQTLSHVRQTGCEFCFGNIFIWAPIYGAEISTCKHFLICRSTDEKPSYSIPKGDGDFTQCIDNLKEEALSEGNPFELYGITDENRLEIENLMPGRFVFTEHRNSFDYLYSREELAELSGKKYHGKRNHISYFCNNFDWKYEEIDSSNMDECFSMNEKWESENKDKPGDLTLEEIAIRRAFDNYSALDFKGGLIRANGEIVAYTMGERLNDNTFCTHFEKAFASVRGAYPMINREFARNTLNDYDFINREEDMGIEGLRKAKLSYCPVTLIKKYRAVEKEAING